MINGELQEIEKELRQFFNALLSENELEWDNKIQNFFENINEEESYYTINVSIRGDIIIDKRSTKLELFRYLVATYDFNNIKITIDASGNHQRAHIHIGIKSDNYHSATIAIDNGEILVSSGSIDAWKVTKIVEWVIENKQVLDKIFRCINPWGDVTSADKRKNKLGDI